MSLNNQGFLSRIVGGSIRSKVTPLLIGFSIFIGLVSIFNLPREEEPQIAVPMFDIFVAYPGASTREVEQRIVNVGERKLWAISGVEYVYSTAQSDGVLFIVRFKVGEDVEKSLTKLYAKVNANLDELVSGASQPLIKVRSIDDVPILSLTFHSVSHDPQSLRKIVAGIQTVVSSIPDVSETTLIGGKKRQFQIYFDEQKLNQRFSNPAEIADAIQKVNIKVTAGHLQTQPELFNVDVDSFLQSKRDLENLIIGVSRGDLVKVSDVARVVDGPDDQESAVNIRFGPGSSQSVKGPLAAVTLAIAKRKGANATELAEKIIHKVDELYANHSIPKDVEFTVTRDYGETANEKANELLFHMALVVIGVGILIALSLGLKEAAVVAVAIPMTLSLTLASFYFMGFTLNRITLFALIFSIGILVDDPIVIVENIVRHLRLLANKGRSILDVTIEAVKEVGSPLILATLAVIAAILPMAFVSGLMGPYMRPIPIGASFAMIFSMIVAFVVTPWAAYQILGRAHKEGKLKGHDQDEKEDFLTRLYRSYMNPLIYNAKIRTIFLYAVLGLFVLAVALVPLRWVKVKMLPFDNKNEFQVILNLPQGTPVEKTSAVLDEIAQSLVRVAEVKDIEAYVGTSAPYNFNGLVRHYFLRSGPHQGDLQVNLVGKDQRKRQSHDIAKSVRPTILAIVEKYNGHVQIAEVPPGPPVLSTLVFEVYGPNLEGQKELAKSIEDFLIGQKGVTDIDTYVAADEQLLRLQVDRQKATLNGIATSTVAHMIALAIQGKVIDQAHLANEHEPVDIILRLPKDKRDDLDALLNINILSRFGLPIPLRDLVTVNQQLKDQPIYHKNMMRVSYVIADVSGNFESPVYAILDLKKGIGQLPLPAGGPEDQKKVQQAFTQQPSSSDQWTVKWDGEWQITYEVFRDLGIAFAVVLILIYVLVVGWFQSFKIPWIIMLPIPLTLVGILPAHWMFGVFFTATSMIGMIAGAGIVVRNAIILVDFIQLRVSQGVPLEEAVIDAGVKRFRPMLLTAAAVVIGASVILFDPIFQGLAVALMAGEIASTILSRTAVPVIYYMAMKQKT
jgi:multidrug efflux pump subunit AcrB